MRMMLRFEGKRWRVGVWLKVGFETQFRCRGFFNCRTGRGRTGVRGPCAGIADGPASRPAVPARDPADPPGSQYAAGPCAAAYTARAMPGP